MRILVMILFSIAITLNVFAGDRKSMNNIIIHAENLPSKKPDGRKWDAIRYADPMVTMYVNYSMIASTLFKKDNLNRYCLL